MPFSVLDCATASSSPTGQVPAIDTSNELMGLPAAAEGRGAGALVDHLRNRCTDLDRGLTGVQQAQLLAFTALLESRIVPAVLYTTWCEDEAYACHTRVRTHLPAAGLYSADPHNWAHGPDDAPSRNGCRGPMAISWRSRSATCCRAVSASRC